MPTVYVAAEKLMTWSCNGRLAIDLAFVDRLIEQNKTYRFVVYFIPDRFGLLLDGNDEVAQAWFYIAHALKAAGFCPDDVMLFLDAVDLSAFKNDAAVNQAALVVSDSARDDAISLCLGIPRREQMPECKSGVFSKISLRRVLRGFVSAAVQLPEI